MNWKMLHVEIRIKLDKKKLPVVCMVFSIDLWKHTFFTPLIVVSIYFFFHPFFIIFRDTGNPKAWNEIIYPGMKNAVVNTLLATMDVTENRKVREGTSCIVAHDSVTHT